MATYPPFHVTVADVSGILYEGEVVMITLPSAAGEMTVLAHHEPIIALLKAGTLHLKYDTDGNEKNIEIRGGLLEVNKNRATILV